MTLEKLLSHIYDLPSIPKVVQDLIENFNSPVADAAAVSKNIQTDPVIAAKVLRLANSVRYGAGREIASLDTAVVLLGMDTLKTLVVASGVTGTFKTIPGLDAKEFWRNSFMVANICKLVAKNVPSWDPEIAFTCGMLHNIGIALMHVGQPDEMINLAANLASDAERESAEQAAFAYDNNIVSAKLAEAWKFPAVIVTALEYQGKPQSCKPFSDYAAIIQLAVFLNRQSETESDSEELIASIPKELKELLHLNTDSLQEQLKVMFDAEDDIDDLLAA